LKASDATNHRRGKWDYFGGEFEIRRRVFHDFNSTPTEPGLNRAHPPRMVYRDYTKFGRPREWPHSRTGGYEHGATGDGRRQANSL
jgi:hypothetical protein